MDDTTCRDSETFCTSSGLIGIDNKISSERDDGESALARVMGEISPIRARVGSRGRRKGDAR